MIEGDGGTSDRLLASMFYVSRSGICLVVASVSDLLRMLLAIFLFVIAILAGARLLLVKIGGIPSRDCRTKDRCLEASHPRSDAIAWDHLLIEGAKVLMASGPPVTIRILARRDGHTRNAIWPPPTSRSIGAR